MMKPLLPLLVSFSVVGCAFQATGGPSWTGLSDPESVATFGLTMHAFRRSNGVAGVRAGTLIDHGLTLQQGFLHGGYDIRVIPGHLVLEPGLDLGFGDPTTHKFDGIGAYAGLSGTARLRVWGTDDSEPSFNVASPAIEIVLAPRTGGWAPPEGSHSHTFYGESAIELGVRVAIGSDLFSNPQGRLPDGTEPSATRAKP
jgi:hypothetical protein